MNQPLYPGGGLQVQGDPGLAESIQDQIHTAWDTYDDVNMQLSLMGFDELPIPPFPKPDITPEQYTQVEGTEYSLLMARVDRWFEYAGNVKSQLEGRLLAIKNEMDIIAVDYRIQTRTNCETTKSKKPSAEEFKDRIKSLPNYRQLMLMEQNLEMALGRVQTTLDGLKRLANGLSRQITIRGQEIDLGGKAQRHGPISGR